MSKGSTTRPQDVDKFNENFDRIFGNKKKKEIEARELLDLAVRNKKEKKHGVWRNTKGWERYDAEQEKIKKGKPNG